MPHSPHRLTALWTLALLIGLATPSAPAQTLEERGFDPVEQTVEDVDPLRRSLRRVETGLRSVGQESRVYRRPNSDDPDKLYYIAQGLVAEFDRSQYDRLRDGTIFQRIPPNTIFHIGLPPADPPDSHDPPPDHPLRVDARVHPRTNRDPLNPADEKPAADRAPLPDPTDWGHYRRFLEVQRRSVMRAIDRAAAPDSP